MEKEKQFNNAEACSCLAYSNCFLLLVLVQELDCLARREVGLVAVTREVEVAALSMRECQECSPELAARLQVGLVI